MLRASEGHHLAHPAARDPFEVYEELFTWYLEEPKDLPSFPATSAKRFLRYVESCGVVPYSEVHYGNRRNPAGIARV